MSAPYIRIPEDVSPDREYKTYNYLEVLRSEVNKFLDRYVPGEKAGRREIKEAERLENFYLNAFEFLITGEPPVNFEPFVPLFDRLTDATLQLAVNPNETNTVFWQRTVDDFSRLGRDYGFSKNFILKFLQKMIQAIINFFMPKGKIPADFGERLLSKLNQVSQPNEPLDELEIDDDAKIMHVSVIPPLSPVENNKQTLEPESKTEELPPSDSTDSTKGGIVAVAKPSALGKPKVGTVSKKQIPPAVEPPSLLDKIKESKTGLEALTIESLLEKKIPSKTVIPNLVNAQDVKTFTSKFPLVSNKFSQEAIDALNKITRGTLNKLTSIMQNRSPSQQEEIVAGLNNFFNNPNSDTVNDIVGYVDQIFDKDKKSTLSLAELSAELEKIKKTFSKPETRESYIKKIKGNSKLLEVIRLFIKENGVKSTVDEFIGEVAEELHFRSKNGKYIPSFDDSDAMLTLFLKIKEELEKQEEVIVPESDAEDDESNPKKDVTVVANTPTAEPTIKAKTPEELLLDDQKKNQKNVTDFLDEFEKNPKYDAAVCGITSKQIVSISPSGGYPLYKFLLLEDPNFVYFVKKLNDEKKFGDVWLLKQIDDRYKKVKAFKELKKAIEVVSPGLLEKNDYEILLDLAFALNTDEKRAALTKKIDDNPGQEKQILEECYKKNKAGEVALLEYLEIDPGKKQVNFLDIIKSGVPQLKKVSQPENKSLSGKSL